MTARQARATHPRPEDAGTLPDPAHEPERTCSSPPGMTAPPHDKTGVPNPQPARPPDHTA